MNYIKQINAFYIHIETNPLSASATVLWHTLMHINNRTHWKKEFSVAANVLCLKSALPASTFKRARLELRDKGYIKYTSRGNEAAMYEIVSLIKEETDESDVTVEKAPKKMDHSPKQRATTKAQTNTMKKAATETTDTGYRSTEPEKIVQQEVEQDSPGLFFPTYTFYTKNFGNPPNYVLEQMAEWAKKLSGQLVHEALVRTVESGVLTWNYTQAILTKWHQERLTTVEAVEQAEAMYRKKRTRANYTNQAPQRKEVIPDWFHKRKQLAGSFT